MSGSLIILTAVAALVAIAVAIAALLLLLRGSPRTGADSTRPPGTKDPGEIRGIHKGFGSGPTSY